jgi:hypothetical protein
MSCSPRYKQDSHDQPSRTRKNLPNLCCGVECNLLKNEIKSAIRNENIPAREFPLDHVYISLDCRWCRTLFVILKSFPRWLFR